MASLALVVGLMFLVVCLSGPITWLLSKSSYVPRFIVWSMGLFSMCVGIYACLLPTNIFRFFGLLTAYLGWLSLNSKER